VYICPLLKKADLDTTDIKNYRPISNLTVLSKLLEKLVARQLIDYLSVNKLLPDRQSAYRAFRSTETAIAGLMPDILLALDAGDIAALALLDLSAAFDTVDHTILIQRLRTSFGLNDAVLSWFRSYLDQRRQHVCHRGEQSALSIVLFGVPQGSVLGPLLFVMYTADFVNIVERQRLSAHQYADDIQVYSRCRSNHSTSLCHDLGGCIEHVASWMGTNRLQLNAAKTEFIWFVPPHQRQQFQSDRLAVGSVQVTPAASVRDLGVYLDSNMSVRSHVTRLVCTCFSIL